MITAVVDTNVLVAGFVRHRPDSPPVQLIDAWRARLYTMVASEHILAEVERTLQEPYFAARLTPPQIADALALLRQQATLTPISAQIQGVASHPEDDLILATALSAPADYLVTGDKRLQELGTCREVRIVSPREFLEILTSQYAN